MVLPRLAFPDLQFSAIGGFWFFGFVCLFCLFLVFVWCFLLFCFGFCFYTLERASLVGGCRGEGDSQAQRGAPTGWIP